MGFRRSAILGAWGLLAGCTATDTPNQSLPSPADSGTAIDGSTPGGTGGDAGGSGGATGADGGGDANGSGNGMMPDAALGDSGPAGSSDAQVPNPPGKPWPEGEGPAATVRLNHVQMIGTHNSYHIAPLIAVDASHRYTHKPLDEQLEGGVRAFELDLHGSTDGKIRVYHIQALDDRTTCSTLKECLQTIKAWSDEQPTHTPIFVWFEIKNDASLTPAIDDLLDVEREILDVIPADRLITADFVRGNFPSARARVEAEGWPALRDVGGMFAFALIDRDDLAKKYSANSTSLDGRKIWINAAADQHTQPWALITKVGGPGDKDEIADALEHQLLVATNICAINNSDDECQTKLDTGLGNGLHMLKDDLPFPIAGRSYSAKLAHGSPGCNALTAPADCDASQFE